MSETRTREIKIMRHMDDEYRELTAVGTVEVEEDTEGNETFGEPMYTVTDNEQISLTDAEKTDLNAELGIPSEPDEISEEDFEDANPHEDGDANEEEEEKEEEV